MQYRTHRRFDKAYAKLPRKKQLVVDYAPMTFINDPADPALRVHSLQGEWLGHKSISAGGDLRIHFIEKDNNTIIVFVAVGTHSQLYQ